VRTRQVVSNVVASPVIKIMVMGVSG